MLLRVVLLFAVSATLNSQFEDRPYFSVSSGQTFGSEAKPSVQLSAFGLKAVRIRVYRVNDAVQFMRGMPDAHQFGGAYRHGSGKMTPLERLHSWKRDLRRDIRRDLRSQFTEAPSAHLHWGEKEETRTPGEGRLLCGSSGIERTAACALVHAVGYSNRESLGFAEG